MTELILRSFLVLVTGWACGDAFIKCCLVIKNWKEQSNIKSLCIRIILFLLSYALFLYIFREYR